MTGANDARSPRVLIVDDMLVNRMILSSLLSSHGVTSDLAENGKECLELYKKNKYDLILLDHRMPELDGVDTLVELKEIFRKDGREIPVICHTTEAGRDNINLYKAAGFADVIIKPVDPPSLSKMLITYLPESDIKETIGGEKGQVEHELSLLPAWLKGVPKLDLKKGIENSETAEDYLDALSVFASSIPSKSADIEKFAKDGNRSMYTLRVHSLKSMARLVGATQLAEYAADLEFAGKQGDFEKIDEETDLLLEQYRRFAELLKGLDGEDPIENTGNETKDGKTKGVKRILFVGEGKGLIGKGIIQHLEDVGFRVSQAPDDETGILERRFDGDIVVYYPTGDQEHIHTISNYLSEICRDNRKIYVLAGNTEDVATARKIPLCEYIGAAYERPIDLDDFVGKLQEFSEILYEYRRKKSILVIDDDMDFLTIMEKWLKSDYKVDCVRSGHDALLFLQSSQPDLILLDYEMPEMDGYEVMRMIRNNMEHAAIPIVFLTGKNEREEVMRILERKPDGYLLKSMPKTELLDYLERYFSKSILKG